MVVDIIKKIFVGLILFGLVISCNKVVDSHTKYFNGNSNNCAENNNVEQTTNRNVFFNCVIRKPLTRSFIISPGNEEKITEIGLFGAKFPSSETFGNTTPLNVEANSHLSRSTNFKANFLWPNDGSVNMQFFSYAPYGNSAIALQNGGSLNDNGFPVLKYTTPAAVSDQVDLLYVKTDPINGAVAPNPINLVFQHALTGIVFSLDKQYEYTIKKIILSNVKSVGEFSFGSRSWSALESPSSFECELNYAVPSDYKGKTIMNGTNNVMMLIPQSAEDINIKVIYQTSDGQEESFDGKLGGDWTPGECLNYVINFKSLIITPDIIENFTDGGEL